MSDFSVTKEISIASSPANVWRAITDVNLIPLWMSETEMTVTTDWLVGSNIIFQGRWYKMKYKNTGKILVFDTHVTLSYSHLSSLSRLEDVPENHSVLTFDLEPEGNNTILRLAIDHSPTFEIHKHLDFYWNVTLDVLRRFVESQ